VLYIETHLCLFMKRIQTMPYDLFISYSRADNKNGYVTELIDQLSTDFLQFSGQPLKAFYDASEIRGMEDWRHRILGGLRSSHILLTCLSPNYLKSQYCEWEVNEYLKQEVGLAYFGDGIAPIYFVEVPGWNDRDFERRCAAWVTELRRRQYFDLRPWFYAGRNALRESSVKVQISQLNTQLRERVSRGQKAENSIGNVDSHNTHFVGRLGEIRRLREAVALGRVGVVIAVHGLGGVGKTTLAVEYAHAFAAEYGGGRWQVRCEGKEDLRSAIVELAPALRIEFTETEKIDLELQFLRVMAVLRHLSESREPRRCLLLLDNVDRPTLLDPSQTKRLPASDWLHVIATSRLGEAELFARHQDRALLPVDELPEENAVELIQSYQPNARFRSTAEPASALEIVRILGGFTIAVEAAAVYLGEFYETVSFTDFLNRLRTEGLEGLDSASLTSVEGIRHGEKSVSATLAPVFECLTDAQRLALTYASLLPADFVALPWIRTLVADKFAELGKDAEPGYPDPWRQLLRRLLSLRLLRLSHITSHETDLTVGRMHRLVQETFLVRSRQSTIEMQARLVELANRKAESRFENAFKGQLTNKHILLFDEAYELTKTA
jgi:hypothetical protein